MNIAAIKDQMMRELRRRGVIGTPEFDHIEHIANLIGIDGVGIGFDFFEFIYSQWPESEKKQLAEKLTTPHFIPDLSNHSQAQNLTRKLIERGFSDEQIEKILRRNWLRIFQEWL